MEKSAVVGLSRGGIYSRRRVYSFLGDSSQRSNSKGHRVPVGPSVTSPGWRFGHRFRSRRRLLPLLQRDARHRYKAPLRLQNLTTVTVTARLPSPSRPTVTSPEAQLSPLQPDICHRYSETPVTVTTNRYISRSPQLSPLQALVTVTARHPSPLQRDVCHRYIEPLQASVTVTQRRLSPLHRAVTSPCHRYTEVPYTVT